jgi:hypothetical protein
MALMFITKETLVTLPLRLPVCPAVLLYVLFSEQVDKAMTVGSAFKG